MIFFIVNTYFCNAGKIYWFQTKSTGQNFEIYWSDLSDLSHVWTALRGPAVLKTVVLAQVFVILNWLQKSRRLLWNTHLQFHNLWQISKELVNRALDKKICVTHTHVSVDELLKNIE